MFKAVYSFIKSFFVRVTPFAVLVQGGRLGPDSYRRIASYLNDKDNLNKVLVLECNEPGAVIKVVRLADGGELPTIEIQRSADVEHDAAP